MVTLLLAQFFSQMDAAKSFSSATDGKKMGKKTKPMGILLTVQWGALIIDLEGQWYLFRDCHVKNSQVRRSAYNEAEQI